MKKLFIWLAKIYSPIMIFVYIGVFTNKMLEFETNIDFIDILIYAGIWGIVFIPLIAVLIYFGFIHKE